MDKNNTNWNADHPSKPARYTLGQVTIIKKFKEALFSAFERERVRLTAQDALNFTMRQEITPEPIGNSGLPTSLVSDFKDTVPQVIRWLQTIEDHMGAQMKMPMVACVKIILDCHSPDKTNGLFRCDCVLSLDADGNE